MDHRIGFDRSRNILGLRFGMLKVVARSGTQVTPAGTRNALWLCKCDCGTVKTMITGALTRTDEPSRSCGCQAKVAGGKARLRHGMAGTPEYAAWQAMKARCTNPKNPNYHLYGGRGIKVCKRWTDFAMFFADMGPRPSDHHSLDRIDNDGGYCPANCRWATNVEQHNNRGNNHRVTFRGKTKTVTDWARKFGIKPSLVAWRIREGWGVKKALTTPALIRPLKTRAR